MRFWIASADGPREMVADVLTSEPCRSERDGWIDRIATGFARWSMDDTTGYGVAEHLVLQKQKDE